MKVIWLTNAIPACVASERGDKTGVSAGWLDAVSDMFVGDCQFEMIFIFPDHKLKSNKQGKTDRFKWYSFRVSKKAATAYSKNREIFFREILSYERPDIVHIWGTEYSHCSEMLYACDDGFTSVVSMQGLISECAKKYTDFLPDRVIRSTTFHDLIRRDNIYEQRRAFLMRGELEIKALRKARHVIGRTAWDKSVAKSINPNISYHECEEILRQSFYEEPFWAYKNCEKHSIFMTESYYPIKGMHTALEIVYALKEKYQDIHLYTTGRDPRDASIKGRLRRNSYEKYICELISTYDLDDNVSYMGRLNVDEIKKMYLKCNVYLQASLIENSTNSLAEAMLLGMPVVASDVGGTRSVLGDYAADRVFDINDLAKAEEMIDKIMEDSPQEDSEVSDGMRDYARIKHDKDEVLRQYTDCYRSIVVQNERAGHSIRI